YHRRIYHLARITKQCAGSGHQSPFVQTAYCTHKWVFNKKQAVNNFALYEYNNSDGCPIKRATNTGIMKQFLLIISGCILLSFGTQAQSPARISPELATLVNVPFLIPESAPR